MTQVPCYPDFVPMSLELKDILHPRLSLTADGISEFTFSGLYLFRNRYDYKISRDGKNGNFIISGKDAASVGKRFFMTPCGAPYNDTLMSLFENHDYWKNISETIIASSGAMLEECGILINEDRDNFDYLHFRNEIAELKGKKFHKKKNHVNNFINNYSYEYQPFTSAFLEQAVEILDQWRQDKGGDGDYFSAREALEAFNSLALKGSIFFAEGRPAGYCLGESIAKGKMFAIHFEKAIDHYKGIYQFMNQAFAASLPRFFIYLNREQDLGDKGLRQAKMSYRPCAYVKKFKGTLKEKIQ